MKKFAWAAVIAFAAITPAFADGKPSADEAAKVAAALTALGCEAGEVEKETEGTGAYEVDDAKCKFGGQWDIKLDKDFKAISMTRD